VIARGKKSAVAVATRLRAACRPALPIKRPTWKAVGAVPSERDAVVISIGD